MVETNEIRRKYNCLYEKLRNYTWDFSTIQVLAELEVSTYTSFPDMLSLRNQLSRLKMCIREMYMEDEELQEAFDDFESTLNNNDDVYMKLDKVREVIR